ncbi:MAG TPA: tetratricopeptide repeat protein [Geothrix sp.]|nr:tetratricopeptide repeat protein [Geothrix sp.]
MAVGCAKRPADVWPLRLSTALAGRAAAVPVPERAEYESGFKDGAAMVHLALKAGLRPYRPVLDSPAGPLRWRGAVPEGVQVDAFTPVPEVDAATGLLSFPANAVASGAFARGQVDGFSWALAAIGQILVRPVGEVVLPATWRPFTKPQEGQDLEVGRKTVRLLWAPGHLAWARKERGFPGLRAWRSWEDAAAPRWVGLTEQALWVETLGGQAVALDLESGGILKVLPAVHHEPSPKERTWESYKEEVRREFNDPDFQRALAGLRRAAESGRIDDVLAVAERLGGMGDEAEREAYTWYLKAAELGSPKAMLRVGVLLFHGQAVAGDRTASRAWLERAAQAGQPEAGDVLKMLFQTSE